MCHGQDVLTWLPQAPRCRFLDSSAEGVRERHSQAGLPGSHAVSATSFNFLRCMTIIDSRRRIFERGELFIVVFKFDLRDVYLL